VSLIVCLCKVSNRNKWSGADMAAALGHLQLEETSSAMEGLLSFYLHCLGSTVVVIAKVLR